MKRSLLPLLLVILTIGMLANGAGTASWTADLKEGKSAFQFMGPLAFGPEGILFISDTKAAAVTAIATGDSKAATARPIKIEGVDLKLASLLGTAADQIQIQDLAVNPVSHNAYLAVSVGDFPRANGQRRDTTRDSSNHC